MIPKAVIFDLDETLAESKQAITPSMAALLAELLSRMPVGIASGGKYEILQANVVAKLPETSDLGNLYLLPTCGSALYTYRNTEWIPIYAELLSESEMEEIEAGIRRAMNETKLIDETEEPYGVRIERRASQVTLSALGQTAPLEKKAAWDPDHVKRPVLRDAITRALPNWSVKTGGTTSFDITKPGIDKAFGVTKLSEYLKLPITDLLYVGDALFPGGNDEVVKQTGIETKETTGPGQTEAIIHDILTSF